MQTPDSQSKVRPIVIEAGRPFGAYWADLWKFRELLYFLSLRDILVRYKQTVIGIAWSVIRPLLTMAVFVIVFSKVAKLPSAAAPYPILVYAALMPWQFFATALSESSNSLVGNSGLITKVYFPRLIVPVSVVASCLIDFLISMVLLGILMACYGFCPDWHIMAVPLFLSMLVGLSVGAGIWLSAITAKYRDFRFVVPFVVQIGLYISPVGFDSSLVPGQWRTLFAANPMVGIIGGFRWSLMGGRNDLSSSDVGLTLLAIIVLWVLGIRYFRSTERDFADFI